MEWFLKCVKEHYFDFNGRARRKEYWMFTLVNIIISVALSVVLGLISEKLLPIANLYSLAVLLPALGVTARRLHDINKSGWWMLIALIPIVGLYLIYLLARTATPARTSTARTRRASPDSFPPGRTARRSLPVSFPPLTGVRMPRSHSGALRQRPQRGSPCPTPSTH